MALGHVPSVKLGAYTWRKGLYAVKTGSKWAHFTCLCTPNGPISFLGKRVFDPFLTHVWFHNGPVSRPFGIFHGPKRVTMGLKRAKNTCLSIPNGLGRLLEKCVFDPFLTHFPSQNGPFSRPFGISWAKTRHHGLKMGKNDLFEYPGWSRNNFGKIFFFRSGDPGGPTIGPHRVRPRLPSSATN